MHLNIPKENIRLKCKINFDANHQQIKCRIQMKGHLTQEYFNRL